jgi:hypothetical protein
MCKEGEDGRLEKGIEKVAIFSKDFKNGKPREPTHAAIQSPRRNGKWRSKMGKDEDIEHELLILEGRLYGTVQFFMWRTLSEKKSAIEMLKNREIPSH